MNIKRLRNKNIFVTGGTGALGQSFCTEFVKNGANVTFSWYKNQKIATNLLGRLKKINPNCHSIFLDITKKQQVKQAVGDLIKLIDRIDILVNNSGISEALPFAFIEENDWEKLMNVNIKGTFLVTSSVLPHMVRQRSGKILNIGSIAGTRMIEAPVHYCTSKAALIGFTQSLSKEVGRYHIQVNCLAPGLLNKGVAEKLPPNKLETYLEQTALGRVGTVEEAARCAAFLISDKNSYMTGSIISMDGGL